MHDGGDHHTRARGCQYRRMVEALSYLLYLLTTPSGRGKSIQQHCGRKTVNLRSFACSLIVSLMMSRLSHIRYRMRLAGPSPAVAQHWPTAGGEVRPEVLGTVEAAPLCGGAGQRLDLVDEALVLVEDSSARGPSQPVNSDGSMGAGRKQPQAANTPTTPTTHTVPVLEVPRRSKGGVSILRPRFFTGQKKNHGV